MALLSMPLLAAAHSGADCCKPGDTACCSEKCCKTSDNCCKGTHHDDCAKHCKEPEKTGK